MNGCHNREPFRESLVVQDGWNVDGTRHTKVIPFVMSEDCQHDRRATDKGCDGCKWRVSDDKRTAYA